MTTHSVTGRTKIDVIIPAIDKDLATLPHVIDGIRKYVKHKIGHIFIISPDSPRIKSLCLRKKCKFVHENSVLPITKRHIHYRNHKWDRSGWLFQQLLKLSADKISTQRYFLVMDADTVLIRPHTFLENGKTIFYTRSRSHQAYFKVHTKLLGQKTFAARSFVNHYMLFDSRKLRHLKQEIEAQSGTAWYKAILRKIDKTYKFSFSEFETYGNFVRARYPGTSVIRRNLNKEIRTGIRTLTPALRSTLSVKFRSLSFHVRRTYY
ncbi:DUF6492 family protein [Paenibacillus sp. FJAT-26967]|uniref:DUF6492 family protein n=1 Tax=Paenibacillus sp. FJAT-26967 TaxID=1729690 RepID=UPI000839AB4C|nr:DUF6492 family protein [Paenibacillus sp. FJAT-26967]